MEKWLPKVPEPPQGVEIVTDRWGEAGVIVVVPKLVDPVPADSRTTPVMTAHKVWDNDHDHGQVGRGRGNSGSPQARGSCPGRQQES